MWQHRFIPPLTTKNAYMVDGAPGNRGRLDETAAGDLDSSMENPWAGDSLSDIEGFCFDLGRSKPKQYQPSMFAVLDAAGFFRREVILCSQVWKMVSIRVDRVDSSGTATPVVKRKTAWLRKYRKSFNGPDCRPQQLLISTSNAIGKMRIPWNVADTTYGLLRIGHKGWEDFGRKLKGRAGELADGRAENRKNGWYECVNFLELGLSEEEALEKDRKLQWLKDESLI